MVQGLPSSQVAGGPPAQFPPEHASFTVQGLPSLQGAVLFIWTQPTAGAHASSVQGLPSSQAAGGPLTHTPFPQVSFVVHALPSLQGAVLVWWVHPIPGTQASSVQGFASPQASGGPPMHAPPEQASFVVQTFPSSQGPLTGPPGWHDPPPHVSPEVQTLPSLQGAELLVCTHPEPGLQPSSVQGFPSLQFGGGPPAQVPAVHTSFVVQALPSLHGALLFA